MTQALGLPLPAQAGAALRPSNSGTSRRRRWQRLHRSIAGARNARSQGPPEAPDTPTLAGDSEQARTPGSRGSRRLPGGDSSQ